MSEVPSGYYTDADAIRIALGKHGPLSRADLVKASDVPRTALAKALYQLKKHGDVIEEGDLVMLAKGPIIAQDERKEAQSMGYTTQGEKIDSRGVSGAGMGFDGAGCLGGLDKAWPDAPMEDPDQPLRGALSLIMAELPALLEDRQKLRKLREVLG